MLGADYPCSLTRWQCTACHARHVVHHVVLNARERGSTVSSLLLTVLSYLHGRCGTGWQRQLALVVCLEVGESKERWAVMTRH